MLTVSPVLRSIAAMPTSADLLETSEASCCSSPTRLGDEAAKAGCAENASNAKRIALNRIALTRALPRLRPNHRQTPTFVPNCKNYSLRDGKCEQSRRPHRLAPSPRPEAPQFEHFSQIAP